MKPAGDKPGALDLFALGGVSAAVLGFEVLLLRLFEFSHWHHFAGLTIALALLGLGAAGTVLSLAGARAVRFGDRWFVAGMLITAAGLFLVIWLQAHIALRPLFAAFDGGELLRLLAVDLAAFVPFFGAGLAIGQVFPRWPGYPARLYSANLVGSGIGAVAASLLLVVLPVASALVAVALTLLGLTLVLALARGMKWPVVAALVLLIPAGPMVVQPPAPAVSDFKALSRVLDLPDAEILADGPGLKGRLTVVRSESLRFAPGLSLNWTRPVATADAAIVGSDRLVPIRRSYAEAPVYAAASLEGLALRLRPDGNVLALGPGSWSTPGLAGPRPLTWVEPDRRLLALAAARNAESSMRLVTDSPYRFLVTGRKRFSVISFDFAFDGADASNESYVMTVEGLTRALGRLVPDGLLAIPLVLDYPPRQGPRALATVNQALKAAGAERPDAQVVALRGMQALLILVTPSPLAAADIHAVREFAERWSFDLVWLPGMDEVEANRHHQLDEPVFHRSARAIFDSTELPETAQWFETTPAGMNRPYFWRAMRWSRVPELFDRLGNEALAHLDWTLLMSALALVVVTALALVLILAPLGRMPAIRAPFRRISVAGYFIALGLAYMLLEIAVFQRAILFLGEPVLTASVVFALFLTGSGMGAAMTPQARRAGIVGRIYGAIALGLIMTIGALWLMHDLMAAPGLGWRIALLCGVLLPMTWAMGRPFPWALGQLAGQPRWLPWGWGINAFASVAGASMAPLISVHLGQTTTLAAGAACYIAACLIALSWCRTAWPGVATPGIAFRLRLHRLHFFENEPSSRHETSRAVRGTASTSSWWRRRCRRPCPGSGQSARQPWQVARARCRYRGPTGRAQGRPAEAGSGQMSGKSETAR